MIRRLLILAGASAAVMVLAVACGADDRPVTAPRSTEPSGGGVGVTITAKDISLSPESVRAVAGPVHITYRNEGAIEHTLVIEGVNGFKLHVRAKGDVDRGSVILRPGTYTVYCDIPGHRQGGMHAVLTVE